MEFLKEYWWCFVVLAIIIAIVIVGLVIGIKTRKEENTETKEQNKDTKEKKVETVKDNNIETLEENKNDENIVNEDKSTKQTKARYVVTYDKEAKQWVVKKTNSQRASKRCKTKAEALEVAERLSKNKELALTVKKKDGKFQKQR